MNRATMYCLQCKQLLHVPELHNKAHKLVKVPSERQMRHWAFDSVCKTPDGCKTEPDGGCRHGFQSWLMIAGIL